MRNITVVLIPNEPTPVTPTLNTEEILVKQVEVPTQATINAELNVNDIIAKVVDINTDNITVESINTESELIKLLKEVIIRFNTEPKLYEKKDFNQLLKLITGLKTILELQILDLDDKKLNKADIFTKLSLLIDDLGNHPVHTHQLYDDAIALLNTLITLIDQALTTKLDIILDLETIRLGAAKGATALLEETDPIFKASPAATITQEQINKWDNQAPSQIQSDWEQTDTTKLDYIKNKPDLSTKMNNDGSNYVAGLDLVTPSISSNWIIKNQSGEEQSTSSNNSISVEKGAVVDYSGKWKYPNSTSTQKVPTSCYTTSGTTGWGATLPAVDTYSDVLLVNNITSNSSFGETIAAPKSGLIISGSKVVPASGDDTKSVSSSVSFYYRRFWGTSTSDTVDITTLSSELSNSKAKDITFDCSGGKYFYYVYPKVLGDTTWKVGGLSFTGYTRIEETITNEYGSDIEYYVYRSTYIQTGSDIKVNIV